MTQNDSNGALHKLKPAESRPSRQTGPGKPDKPQREPRFKYTIYEDEFLVKAKEIDRWSWPKTHKKFLETFPGRLRKRAALKSRYDRRLKRGAREPLGEQQNGGQNGQRDEEQNVRQDEQQNGKLDLGDEDYGDLDGQLDPLASFWASTEPQPRASLEEIGSAGMTDGTVGGDGLDMWAGGSRWEDTGQPIMTGQLPDLEGDGPGDDGHATGAAQTGGQLAYTLPI